jgi:hypothetical protein
VHACRYLPIGQAVLRRDSAKASPSYEVCFDLICCGCRQIEQVRRCRPMLTGFCIALGLSIRPPRRQLVPYPTGLGIVGLEPSSRVSFPADSRAPRHRATAHALTFHVDSPCGSLQSSFREVTFCHKILLRLRASCKCFPQIIHRASDLTACLRIPIC